MRDELMLTIIRYITSEGSQNTMEDAEKINKDDSNNTDQLSRISQFDDESDNASVESIHLKRSGIIALRKLSQLPPSVSNELQSEILMKLIPQTRFDISFRQQVILNKLIDDMQEDQIIILDEESVLVKNLNGIQDQFQKVQGDIPNFTGLISSLVLTFLQTSTTSLNVQLSKNKNNQTSTHQKDNINSQETKIQSGNDIEMDVFLRLCGIILPFTRHQLAQLRYSALDIYITLLRTFIVQTSERIKSLYPPNQPVDNLLNFRCLGVIIALLTPRIVDDYINIRQLACDSLGLSLFADQIFHNDIRVGFDNIPSSEIIGVSELRSFVQLYPDGNEIDWWRKREVPTQQYKQNNSNNSHNNLFNKFSLNNLKIKNQQQMSTTSQAPTPPPPMEHRDLISSIQINNEQIPQPPPSQPNIILTSFITQKLSKYLNTYLKLEEFIDTVAALIRFGCSDPTHQGKLLCMKMAYGLIVRIEHSGSGKQIIDLLTNNQGEISLVNNLKNIQLVPSKLISSKLIPSEAVHTLVKCIIDAITLESSQALSSSTSSSLAQEIRDNTLHRSSLSQFIGDRKSDSLNQLNQQPTPLLLKTSSFGVSYKIIQNNTKQEEVDHSWIVTDSAIIGGYSNHIIPLPSYPQKQLPYNVQRAVLMCIQALSVNHSQNVFNQLLELTQERRNQANLAFQQIVCEVQDNSSLQQSINDIDLIQQIVFSIRTNCAHNLMKFLLNIINGPNQYEIKQTREKEIYKPLSKPHAAVQALNSIFKMPHRKLKQQSQEVQNREKQHKSIEIMRNDLDHSLSIYDVKFEQKILKQDDIEDCIASIDSMKSEISENYQSSNNLHLNDSSPSFIKMYIPAVATTLLAHIGVLHVCDNEVDKNSFNGGINEHLMFVCDALKNIFQYIGLINIKTKILYPITYKCDSPLHLTAIDQETVNEGVVADYYESLMDSDRSEAQKQLIFSSQALSAAQSGVALFKDKKQAQKEEIIAHEQEQKAIDEIKRLGIPPINLWNAVSDKKHFASFVFACGHKIASWWMYNETHSNKKMNESYQDNEEEKNKDIETQQLDDNESYFDENIKANIINLLDQQSLDKSIDQGIIEEYVNAAITQSNSPFVTQRLGAVSLLTAASSLINLNVSQQQYYQMNNQLDINAKQNLLIYRIGSTLIQRATDVDSNVRDSAFAGISILASLIQRSAVQSASRLVILAKQKQLDTNNDLDEFISTGYKAAHILLTSWKGESALRIGGCSLLYSLTQSQTKTNNIESLKQIQPIVPLVCILLADTDPSNDTKIVADGLYNTVAQQFSKDIPDLMVQVFIPTLTYILGKNSSTQIQSQPSELYYSPTLQPSSNVKIASCLFLGNFLREVPNELKGSTAAHRHISRHSSPNPIQNQTSGLKQNIQDNNLLGNAIVSNAEMPDDGLEADVLQRQASLEHQRRQLLMNAIRAIIGLLNDDSKNVKASASRALGWLWDF
ncbi:MAG: hypothetical protein EZS28_004692 [Streblomastix strix]|uniref:Uncharacterized protein n=1 Tax=Streblomastix strix TaxID=222440 RepID=A0A5J4WY44_9EUKA|nr:MAG: hypothetical protein EZS28_004692 [Streblomastix strix]